MLVNRPTADELADVRDEIRVLKAREQELRDTVLQDPGKCRGVTHEVMIRCHKRRVFLRDKLPPNILQNPEFWEERKANYVTVRRRENPKADNALPTGRAIRPGDPVGLHEERAAFTWAMKEEAVIEAFGD